MRTKSLLNTSSSPLSKFINNDTVSSPLSFEYNICVSGILETDALSVLLSTNNLLISEPALPIIM
jgi:hypothetical protein